MSDEDNRPGPLSSKEYEFLLGEVEKSHSSYVSAIVKDFQLLSNAGVNPQWLKRMCGDAYAAAKILLGPERSMGPIEQGKIQEAQTKLAAAVGEVRTGIERHTDKPIYGLLKSILREVEAIALIAQTNDTALSREFALAQLAEGKGVVANLPERPERRR